MIETLRFITCGSVDDGKSTLIGRLLFESKAIFNDQLAAWADLELIDDRQANQFKVIVRRPPQVSSQVMQLLSVMAGEMSRLELMQALQLKDRKSFAQTYLLPAINNGCIEMTQPDKPQSSKQRYRISAIGMQAKLSG